MIPFKINIIEKPHTQTHSFASRSLIFKLQQEVLKFNNIYMSWSSPETNLVTNFLTPENQW